MPVEPPVLWSVVEKHLDDAGFQWTPRWERAHVSPVLRAYEVASGIEEQLAANVDALAIAAPHASAKLLEPALTGDEPGEAAVAALALLGVPTGFLLVRRALTGGEGQRTAVVRALALSDRVGLEREVEPQLREQHPAGVVAALEVFAARRLDPGAGLFAFLTSSDTEVAVAALRAARTSTQRVRSAIEHAFGVGEARVREAALETGLVLGFHSALEASRKLAASGAPSAVALATLAMSGAVADLALVEGALSNPGLRRVALFALGFAGRSGSMEKVLESMQVPGLARGAGEAFSAITGIAIDGELVAWEGEDEQSAEDDPSAGLLPGQDGDLPLPDASAAEARWAAVRSRFDPAVRYLDGEPFTPQRLVEAFRSASMRRRRFLALELATRSRRTRLVDTRAWARDQLVAERRDAPPMFSDAAAPLSRVLVN